MIFWIEFEENTVTDQTCSDTAINHFGMCPWFVDVLVSF